MYPCYTVMIEPNVSSYNLVGPFGLDISFLFESLMLCNDRVGEEILSKKVDLG